MPKKYTFNLSTYDSTNYVDFCQISEAIKDFEPLTNWEDIHIGDRLHIPPIVIYGRREFVVSTITNNYISGKLKEFGTNYWKEYTIFKSEITARFLAKVINK